MKIFRNLLVSIVYFLILLVNINPILADEEKKLETGITSEIEYAPQKSIGYFIAAVLNLQSINFDLINEHAVKELMNYKVKLKSGDLTEKTDYKKLIADLNEYSKVQKLLYIPDFFNNYAEMIVAFNLILGKNSVIGENDKILNILKNTFFIEYPFMESLTAKEREIGGELVDFINSLYTLDFKKFFTVNNDMIQKNIDMFSDAWDDSYGPAVSVLNINGEINKIKILLTPIISTKKTGFGEINKIGCVTSLLPYNKDELNRSLMLTYYRICYQIAEAYLSESNADVRKSLNNEEYLLLLKHSAEQLMYEGIRVTMPGQMSSFINSEYGKQNEFLNDKLLQMSIKSTGRDLTKEELKNLKYNLKNNLERSSKFIFQKGLFVTKELFDAFRGKLKNRLHINVDTEAAVSMYRVILALHNKLPLDKIEKLIDEAFKKRAYQLSEKINTLTIHNDINSVSLNEFRSFLLGLRDDEILTQGNQSLQFIASNYVDATMNPDKYISAIEQYNSLPMSFYENALKNVNKWLPSNISGENINLWILFDMKEGMKLFENNILLDIFTSIDRDGNIDKGLYFHAVCYGIFRFAYNSLDLYQSKTAYVNLPDSSRIKMIMYFIYKFMSEGAAEKACFNMPGVISKKIQPDSKSEWINNYYKNNWMEFQKDSVEIFDKAKKDLNDVIAGKYKSISAFVYTYDKYWMIYGSNNYSSENKFVFGRRFYLGAEIMGVIYDAFGEKGVEEVSTNIFKVIPMFNKALLKTKPENYEKYLFPDNVVNFLDCIKISNLSVVDLPETSKNETKSANIGEKSSSNKKNLISRNIGEL